MINTKDLNEQEELEIRRHPAYKIGYDAYTKWKNNGMKGDVDQYEPPSTPVQIGRCVVNEKWIWTRAAWAVYSPRDHGALRCIDKTPIIPTFEPEQLDLF